MILIRFLLADTVPSSRAVEDNGKKLAQAAAVQVRSKGSDNASHRPQCRPMKATLGGFAAGANTAATMAG